MAALGELIEFRLELRVVQRLRRPAGAAVATCTRRLELFCLFSFMMARMACACFLLISMTWSSASRDLVAFDRSSVAVSYAAISSRSLATEPPSSLSLSLEAFFFRLLALASNASVRRRLEFSHCYQAQWSGAYLLLKQTQSNTVQRAAHSSTAVRREQRETKPTKLPCYDVLPGRRCGVERRVL